MRFASLFRSRNNTSRWWYARVGAYLAFLLLTAYALNSLRGRLPQALGLTPIRVTVLSVERIGAVSGVGNSTVSVTVRIVGRKDPPVRVTMQQFQMKSKGGTSFRPYASSFPFDSSGALSVARAETLDGVFLFNIPTRETPGELWWNP